MSIEAGLLKIGEAVASAVGKAWLADRKKSAERQMSLLELVSARGVGLIPQRRLARQLQQLAETVAGRLQDFVEIEFGALDEQEKLAALEAVCDTLQAVDLSDRQVFDADVSG